MEAGSYPQVSPLLELLPPLQTQACSYTGHLRHIETPSIPTGQDHCLPKPSLPLSRQHPALSPLNVLASLPLMRGAGAWGREKRVPRKNRRP